jgi:uncharacterized membrane protein YesL
MSEILNLDNKFFQGFNKVVDSFLLNMLWLLCCSPLFYVVYTVWISKAWIMLLLCCVTMVLAGPATTAFYYAVNKVIRHGRGYVWHEFWHAFRTNFKQSTIVSIILTLITLLISADGYIMYQYAKEGEKLGAFYVVFLVLLVFDVMWISYIFPYMARFENNIKVVLKNSAIIAISNLPRTILIFAVLLVVALLLYAQPLLVIILPSIYMLIKNFIMEKVFLKYMSQEDIEAEEERNRDYGD